MIEFRGCKLEAEKEGFTREESIAGAVFFVSCAFAIARACGVNDVFFKDVAHLFVGALFGAGLAGRRLWLLRTAWALSFWELGCFLLGIGHRGS
jgi:hypothetical protein